MAEVDVIAIDGPGGSGKSTASREVARRLGWSHLDTGAYYRTATLSALRAGADPRDLAAVMAAITGRELAQEGGKMTLDGEDVSGEIRSEPVTAAVSSVAAHPPVRALMVRLQREWVAGHGGRAVVEGRDIGTVVFPHARFKVFLTATPEERARRRAKEIGSAPEAVGAELDRRDRFDSSRPTSPLQAAADAIVLDTTRMTIAEVVEQILHEHRARVGG